MLPLLFIASAGSVLLWLTLETRARWHLRVAAGLAALLLMTLSGFQVARIIAAVESTDHYEQLLLEGAMGEMERRLEGGDIAGVRAAVSAYNQSVKNSTNRNYRGYQAAQAISTALPPRK